MKPDAQTQTLRELLVEMEDLERQLVKMRRRVMLALGNGERKKFVKFESPTGKSFEVK